MKIWDTPFFFSLFWISCVVLLIVVFQSDVLVSYRVRSTCWDHVWQVSYLQNPDHSKKKQSPLYFSLSSFFCLAIWQRHISLQLIIHRDPRWKAASSFICTSKRSLAIPGHYRHNDILSKCQEAAKVPNNFAAKLSICGFLGVALAANGLSVRALVQKAPRFICCWFFLETCGFVTSATIHWAVLLYCLILSRVEEDYFWQQNANIFLRRKPPSGALFFSSCPEMMMSKLCKVL